MQVDPSWQLLIALVCLVLLASLVSWRTELKLSRKVWLAALRATLQLLAVSLLITAALSHLLGAVAFALVMFSVAVATSTGRTATRNCWPAVALAMACGVVPVLAIIFCSGTMPLTGVALVPIAGIIIGNTMTGHTLLGRRVFAALRENHGTYEAGLAIGLTRTEVITEMIRDLRQEALLPTIDNTRTVGLVTLPGAFVGVLLGGGSPIQAGAAQLLVLLGIIAAQFVTVAVASRLIASAKELPADLVGELRP